jgi:hypothetical protein
MPRKVTATAPHSPRNPPRFHHKKPTKNTHFFQNTLKNTSKTAKAPVRTRAFFSAKKISQNLKITPATSPS